MPRVKPVEHQSVDPDVVALYDRFASQDKDFTNQLRILEHSPASCRHLYGLINEIKESGTLSDRVIEVAVVTASLVNACQYCVGHHGVALIKGGLTAETIDTMLEERPAGLSEKEIAVRDYARLVTERAWGIRDQVFEALRKWFDDTEIVTLTVRIGITILFNKFNQALQIDMEESAADQIELSGIRLAPDASGT